jgi:putative CocE/NonD family hydrolase
MVSRLVIDKNVMMPTRDGVALATDIYRPDTEGRLPTLVQRTPYNKDLAGVTDIVRIANAGYAVVVQDVRGRFASAGQFQPFIHEAEDGADALAWTASQQWSTGAVGTIGASYVGATQWLAASTSPPALKAMAPVITAADYHDGWTYQGGAFELGFNLNWALGFALTAIERAAAPSAAATESRALLIDAVDTLNDLYRRAPLVDIASVLRAAAYYVTWLDHPDDDTYWQRIAPNAYYERMTAPALNIGGWYDIFLGGTLANYRGMKARGGSALARTGQRLLIGPWSHGVFGSIYAERGYGFRAAGEVVDLTGVQLRWFDHILKGIDNGIAGERPVRLFIMGANVWRDEDDWPLPDTIYRPYYLHSGGHANSLYGDGALTPESPAAEPDDVYLYDPRNPVPTLGGPTLLPGANVAANMGPRDQRSVEIRHDVLCYTTPPLTSPLEVTGPVELILYVSSSARDTDFTGKLVDVAPDGRAEILTEGILRARYRDSPSHPSPLEPGRIYELHLDLWATANVFAAGHRVRLDVSSSNFPRFDRNTNTGGTIAREGLDDFMQAVNRVYHDRTHPSHIVLPVIERA